MILVSLSGGLLAAPINIFKGMTSIEEPFELRDPFKAPNIRIEKDPNIVGKVSTGVYSNIPVLGDVPLDSIQVVGVIIGKERRAFIKLKQGDATGGTSYTVKEGQLMGENDAELKAILPGGLILVEKTTNIYGQEEYLETVIPISK
jgi:type IV pilus assembly protein PilP